MRLLFFSALALQTTADAATPDNDALAAWFTESCDTTTIPLLTGIEPVVLERSANPPELALAVQLSADPIYLEGAPVTLDQLSDGLQEQVDMALALEQISSDATFKFNRRILLIPSSETPGEVLVQVLETAAGLGISTAEFYFNTPQSATIPEILDAAYVEALLAELDPLPPAERQQLLAGRVVSLVETCPPLAPVFQTLSMASPQSTCEVASQGLPPALASCADPALSLQLYTLLHQMSSPMDQPPSTTVTVSLTADGTPLQIAGGDTWQTLHGQVLALDGGALRVGAP